MKLNRTDYVLERASDGGYYAWLTVNMQCNAYGESPEEAVQNLQVTILFSATTILSAVFQPIK
jgi:predicted RNase H-like HicB family nuclease